MNARAGVVTSQVVWLAGLPVFVSGDTFEEKAKNAAAGFIVSALASFWPDLDHGSSTAGRTVGARNSKIIRFMMGGHRMGTHSLLAIFAAWWMTGYLLENQTIANAVAVGWGTHVAIDMLTVQGVALAWPAGYLFILLGRLVLALNGIVHSKTLHSFGRALLALKVLNEKTQVGWITTGSRTEDTFVTWVKGTAVLIGVWYGWLAWPAIQLAILRMGIT